MNNMVFADIVFPTVKLSESFSNYSLRINFRRLQISIFCSMIGFLLHLAFLVICRLPLGLHDKLLDLLIITEIAYLGVDAILLIIVSLMYSKMEVLNNFLPYKNRLLIFHVSLAVLFSGPLTIFSITDVRISLATPFGLICLFQSALFFLDKRITSLYNGIALLSAVAVQFFLIPNRTLDPFIIMTTFGSFVMTGTASFLLQIERKKRYIALQNSLKTSEDDLKIWAKQFTLTEREVQVTGLLLEGYSNKKIAETLVISEHTVRSHVKHIYEKLNISSRLQLVKLLQNTLNG